MCCPSCRSARSQVSASIAGEWQAVQILRAGGERMADVRPLGFEDDVSFCRILPERVGVAAIPASAFFPEGDVGHLARFAFCKTEELLVKAVERLRGVRV